MSSTQTLVLFKPDAIKNSLSGYLLTMLSEFNTGLIIAGMKVVHVSTMLAEEHYAEHKGKGFFPSVIEYIAGKRHFPTEPQRQRVIALVYQGNDAVKVVRDVCGPTDPVKAREQKPGSIRSLGMTFIIHDENGKVVDTQMENLIHASSNDIDAEREIKLWFKPIDIPPLLRSYPAETCKKHYYVNNGILSDSYSDNAICLVAPGDVVWKSDLDSLEALLQKKASTVTLESVSAKYLVNT
jgi:nucleoside-diphosphate kinase